MAKFQLTALLDQSTLLKVRDHDVLVTLLGPGPDGTDTVEVTFTAPDLHEVHAFLSEDEALWDDIDDIILDTVIVD